MTAEVGENVVSAAAPVDRWATSRRTLLLINGGALAVVGAAQVLLELLSYYAGVGIYGPLFHNSPYVVGWVEAHGLAALIGILFLAVGASDGGRRWHVVALSVHSLLGTANIVFWSGFSAFGMVGAGIVATTGHLLLVTAHLTAIASVGRKGQR
jgi:phosphoglycerol transferase MdoB-like AlkP superfamily enzyme